MITIRQFFESHKVEDLRLLRDLLDDVIKEKEDLKKIQDLDKK